MTSPRPSQQLMPRSQCSRLQPFAARLRRQPGASAARTPSACLDPLGPRPWPARELEGERPCDDVG
eukprot:9976648-Alexandrium_andersonii.AAC.1